MLDVSEVAEEGQADIEGRPGVGFNVAGTHESTHDCRSGATAVECGVEDNPDGSATEEDHRHAGRCGLDAANRAVEAGPVQVSGEEVNALGR